MSYLNYKKNQSFLDIYDSMFRIKYEDDLENVKCQLAEAKEKLHQTCEQLEKEKNKYRDVVNENIKLKKQLNKNIENNNVNNLSESVHKYLNLQTELEKSKKNSYYSRKQMDQETKQDHLLKSRHPLKKRIFDKRKLKSQVTAFVQNCQTEWNEINSIVIPKII